MIFPGFCKSFLVNFNLVSPSIQKYLVINRIRDLLKQYLSVFLSYTEFYSTFSLHLFDDVLSIFVNAGISFYNRRGYFTYRHNTLRIYYYCLFQPMTRSSTLFHAYSSVSSSRGDIQQMLNQPFLVDRIIAGQIMCLIKHAQIN